MVRVSSYLLIKDDPIGLCEKYGTGMIRVQLAVVREETMTMMIFVVLKNASSH